MTKWLVFNSFVGIVMIGLVMIAMFKGDWQTVFINSFLFFGILFSILSAKIKSTDAFYPLSLLSFGIAIIALVFKYFIYYI